jgi:uncharacterized protein (DUF2147 family)
MSLPDRIAALLSPIADLAPVLAICAVLQPSAVLAGAPDSSSAASPFGLWKTIDDNTGKPRGVVRVYEQGGELFGKLEQSFTPGAESRVCHVCQDERHDQPMIGLLIIRHMKPDGDAWSGGDILDPDTGKVYRCRLHLANGGSQLVVRGFIGFSLLGRSQTWLRQP